MKERPILFSGAMVRAILAGRKSQTRRISRHLAFVEATPIGAHPMYIHALDCRDGVGMCQATCDGTTLSQAGEPMGGPHSPYGAPGDRLWVRENFSRQNVDGKDTVLYAADGNPSWGRPQWKPSIHMPRWASRITLEVTGVRVERLQAISEEDAMAEGEDLSDPSFAGCWSAIDRFLFLWDSINGKRAPWASNPWIWVVGFQRVEAGERAA